MRSIATCLLIASIVVLGLALAFSTMRCSDMADEQQNSLRRIRRAELPLNERRMLAEIVEEQAAQLQRGIFYNQLLTLGGLSCIGVAAIWWLGIRARTEASTKRKYVIGGSMLGGCGSAVVVGFLGWCLEYEEGFGFRQMGALLYAYWSLVAGAVLGAVAGYLAARARCKKSDILPVERPAGTVAGSAE
jgi:hypothetical protein